MGGFQVVVFVSLVDRRCAGKSRLLDSVIPFDDTDSDFLHPYFIGRVDYFGQSVVQRVLVRGNQDLGHPL